MSTYNGALNVLIDISVATLALTFGWKYAFHLMGHKYVKACLNEMREAKVLSISDLRSFANSESNDNNPLVLVRGMIKPLSPDSPLITSEHGYGEGEGDGGGMKGVLLETIKTSTIDIFNGLSTFLPQLTRTIRTVQHVPFVLAENDTSDSPYVVVNIHNYGDRVVNLTKIAEFVEPTITEFLGVKFPGVMLVQEGMLLVGEKLTAFGNVSVSKDGILEIKACKDCIHFLADKSQLGTKIGLVWGRFTFMCWKTIHGSILLALLLLLFIRIERRFKKRHSKACFQRLYSWLRRLR